MNGQAKPTEKHRYPAYLRKAAEFCAEMKVAQDTGRWNAACLNAIHCAISTADALSVFFLGKRSASQRHEDAAGLLKQIPDPASQEKTRQFLDILRLKNLVEYSSDEPTEAESRRIVQQAERLFAWARQLLPQR